MVFDRFSRLDVVEGESVIAPRAFLPVIVRKLNLGLRSLFVLMVTVVSLCAAPPAFANLPLPIPVEADQDGWAWHGIGTTRYATPQEACLRQFLRFAPTGTREEEIKINETKWECRWSGEVLLRDNHVFFECGPGRISLQPGRCFPVGEIPQIEDSCEAANRKICSSGSPSTDNPVSIPSGAKTWAEEDYSSEDGLLTVKRKYRSKLRGIGFSNTEPDRFGSHWQGLIPGPLMFRTVTTTRVEYLAESGGFYDFSSTLYPTDLSFTASGGTNSKHRLTLEIIAPVPAGMGRQAFIETAPVSAPGVGEFRLEMPNGDYTLYRRPTAAASSYNLDRFAVAVEHGKASGYKQYFDYHGSSPVPYRLRDSYGRQIGFEWVATSDFPGRVRGSDRAIKKLTLPDGTYLEYDYDDGVGRLNPLGQASIGADGAIVWTSGSTIAPKTRLRTVQRKSASGTILWSRRYLYENATYRFALTGIEDGAGRRLSTYTYDTRGDVASTESVGGVNRHEFTRSYPTSTRMIRTVKNPLGRVTEYAFDRTSSAYTNLLSVSGGAIGSVEADQMTYGYSDNRVTSIADRRGTVTDLTNDPTFGRPTLVKDASGTAAEQQTAITWHPKWDLPVVQQEDGLRIDNVYDAQGRLTSTAATDTTTHSLPYPTSGQSRSTAFGWTANGKISQVNGPLAPDAQGRDDITSFAYDAVGNLTSVTDPLGHITTYAGHDANGRAAIMTDPNGVITAMVYDLLGRLTSVNVKHPTNPALDATTGFEYDGEGRVTGITRPQTAKLIVDYSSIGWVTALRSSDGERIEFTYDPMGNVVSQKVKRGDGSVTASITQSFDAIGRLVKTTLGGGRPRSFTYDKEGNVTAVTDPRNLTSNNAFDVLGRLVSTTHPDGGVETTSYNKRDEPTSFKDGIDVTTQFVRNGFGDVIQETSPDRGTSTYYYDAAGRMTAAIDGRGQRIDYAYDIAGRLLSKTPVGRPSSEIVSYSYDTNGIGPYQTGRLTRVTDATGVTQFGYDHRGNLIQRQQAIGSTAAANLSYAYDLADRISEIGYPSGRSVRYSYDSKDRVVAVETRSNAAAGWTSVVSAMTYQPFGAVESMALGNGLVVANDRGTDGRLRSRRLTNVSSASLPVGTKLSDLSYVYDPDGNVTSIDDKVMPERSAIYGYDAMGRLNMMVAEGSATPANYSYTSGTNKLASLTTPAGSRSIAYDNRGNPTAETRPAGQAVTLAYDGHGRLTSYARSGEASLTHSYNGLDDRVATSTTPTGGTADTRRFIYAPDGRVLGEYGSSASDVRAEFIWASPELGDASTFGGDDGLGGYMPLAVAANDTLSGPQLLWVHGNHMGVPALFTNASGAQVAVPASYSLPGFPGQSRTFADLYYNRYRDYDPGTGRYIQADPIGLDGDVNPYLYANANPLGVIDPTGEFGLAGFGVGFALDIGIQMFIEGKSWKCVSIKQALISGAFGAIGAPAWARLGSRGLKQGMSRPNAAFPKGVEWVERSKFWPKRWGGTFSKYNVNPVWGTEHALADPKRYQFLPQWWKKANKPNSLPSRFWHRLPNWFKGATIPSGFASAAQAQTSSENCGCN